MARRKPGTLRRPSGIVRFARDENGKVSIVSILAVMAIFGMIGLVANTGRVAREKIELQTAADAAAATTTLWLARSMNAVTTANHLMGEATAVVVLLDGLGGPDFGSGPAVKTLAGESYQGILKGLRLPAPIKPLGFVAAFAAATDVAFVGRIIDLLTLDGGRTSVGATLYDAKLTLKYVATLCLTAKKFANALLAVALKLEVSIIGIPAGLALEGAALGAHAAANVFLARVATEWLFLTFVVEKPLAIVAPPLSKAVVQSLLPGLSRYGDTVVGSAGLPGGVNRAIRQSLEPLERRHRLASLEIVPPVERLKLPVEREPPPTGGGGEQPPRGWKGDFEQGGVRAVRKLHADLAVSAQTALQGVEGLIRLAGLAAGLVGDVATAFNGGQTPEWVNQIRKAREAAEELAELLARENPLPDPPGPDGFKDNPSRDRRQLPAFDWRSESVSQWTRASYPCVDDYRSPIVAWLRDKAPLSNAATYYVNWTNRFTLVRSHQLRSDAEKTHMHVLREMKPAAKGREPWVTDSQAAADLFAIVAVATREPAAVWLAPRVFGAPGGRTAAVAGGLLYNANGNRVAAARGGTSQPDTGWDTLNWAPPIRAPEWGVGPPSVRRGDPLAVFKSSQPTGPLATIRLNWQGKLVPVDRGLLGRATGAETEFIRRHERLLHH
jgi:hypothetical protein